MPIAISVLTGFLGAGKTTLLNRLLRSPALANTAVIVNEFGEVGIDHLLVEKAADGVIELADGCLCCTVRGELVDTLADLVDRVQTGRVKALDRIVVETSGLADPVPVLQAVIAHPALAAALRLDGVVTVVDALNGQGTLDAHEAALRQVAVADRIVLTKADLAGEAAGAALAARLAALNPSAPVLSAQDEAAVRPEALFDCGLWNPATKSADVSRWLGEAAGDPCRDHHHHDGHDHGYDGNDHGPDAHRPAHDSRVTSLSLVHDAPLAWSTIEMFLDLLRSAHGDRLLRIKGIVELAEDPAQPLVLHGVQRMLHPPARLPAWPEGPRGTRLVLIGFDLDTGHVQRLFAAFTGRPAVDAPDRAALEANPLAVPGFSA